MSPAASVIILSYNRFDTTTGPCLESLLADSGAPDVEIIVVDNHSTDGAGARIRAAVAGRSGVKAILNADNRGYAGGNNDGAAAASAPVLVLLNSDTVVPAGGVGRLCALMAQNPGWAMLGPVTNQAGNEQKIHTEGCDLAAVMAEGNAWCRHADGPAYPSPRLDFFCVAIRSDVYRDLGGLDERFGAGYYEDTDFSLRAARRGLAMMVTESVFVCHHGGMSFAGVGADGVRRLMKENKRRLKAIHGGRVALLHLRDCNRRVMGRYVDEARAAGGAGEGLRYRFDNRMRLADSIHPNSPLKRMLYGCRLKRLQRAFAEAVVRS